MSREVQVAPEHYDFERYDDAERWMSYWHQLRAVLAVRPKTVLEIGSVIGSFVYDRDEFETCLANLARRSNEHVFISLPYRGLRVRLAFWWGDHMLNLGRGKLMLPWRHTPIPEHHWELGYPHTAGRITKRIAKHLDVVSRGFIRENPYHYMWRLKRRPARGELTAARA